MGLFQPIDESIHDVINVNSAFKHQAIPGKYNTKPEGVGIYKAMNTDLKSNKPGITGITRNNIKKAKNQISNGSHNFLKPEKKNYLSGYASASKHYANEATEGISLSTKKLISAGGHNSSDLNAVKPNAEYFDQYDKHFIGDGEDPETSRYNVPAILAAKTAGGAPFDQTLSNGINRASADVFHLKKLRDDEGMNG